MNIPDKLIKDFYTNIYKSFASYFLLTDTALRCYILCDLFTSYLLRVDKKLVTITINSNKHTVVYYNGDTYDPMLGIVFRNYKYANTIIPAWEKLYNVDFDISLSIHDFYSKQALTDTDSLSYKLSLNYIPKYINKFTVDRIDNKIKRIVP